MRLFVLTMMLGISVSSWALAAVDEFPGAKIKDKAPFNLPTMTLGQAVCPTAYTEQQLTTQRRQIAAAVKACVDQRFAAAKDLEMDYGNGKFDDCLVPDKFAHASGGLPMWPVCCPVGKEGAKQFMCISYVVPGGQGLGEKE